MPVSRRLTEVTTTTLLDHGMFGLFNEDFGEGLVAPHIEADAGELR